MVDVTRPKRRSAVNAALKIQSVLEWESMSRDHPTYIAVENAINAEFEKEGKKKRARADAEVPIEYDVMSDSEESMEDITEDCVYEPCADSVHSAEEEDVRSESSLCSSGMESLSRNNDDSDTSIVDFSADDDDADEDTSEDDTQMYDDDEMDDDESIPLLEATPDNIPLLEATPDVMVCTEQMITSLWSDTVYNAHTLSVDAIDEHHSSDELLSAVLLSDVVSESECHVEGCMLPQGTDSCEYVQLPEDAFQQYDDHVAMFSAECYLPE